MSTHGAEIVLNGRKGLRRQLCFGGKTEIKCNLQTMEGEEVKENIKFIMAYF